MEDRKNSNCVEFKGSLYSNIFLLLALLLSFIQDGELYDWVAKASFTNANSKAFSDFPGREQHFSCLCQCHALCHPLLRTESFLPRSQCCLSLLNPGFAQA